MVRDAREAPALYSPTNYWAVYNTSILPEILEHGLRDFRCRTSTMLHKFNATDLRPAPPVDFTRLRLFNNRLARMVPGLPGTLLQMNRLQDAVDRRRLVGSVRSRAKTSRGRPLQDLNASMAGNPEDRFRIGDKVYTRSILGYYLSYLYCTNFVEFESLRVVAELGPGSGKQVEVLKKLHPHLSFYLFDIPPQLYVCEQYLKTVFPESVVPYMRTRELRSLPQDAPGKIFILGNWQFPLLSSAQVDLFWSAYTFQEMEPHVTANYLSYVDRAARTAYLCQEMGGKNRATAPGRPGVLEPTVFEDYKKNLTNLDLVDLTRPWPTADSDTAHASFWVRR